ncbi:MULTISPECIES: hypothetical protein [unclassified Burkholderia]|uniref:hypothetical protein n=1 Tax=unclassified Burkholderia TaxID=2613784 RepID=UPI002ABDE019|nr:MULTISPECIES: hypothetical protein [unclassified Burkholderia]
MDIKIFNICLLLGWLMVLAGGIVINPGWGIAIAGGLLVMLTLMAAYIAGWAQPTGTKPDNNEPA